MIRLTTPDIDDTDVAAVAGVLRTGHLVQAAHVQSFERRVAAAAAVDHAVAVSSGTAALHVVLEALGIGRGSRVAVSAYSWPATANAVALTGAEVAFVDVDAATGNINPEHLDAVLGQQPTAVVLVVHAFGRMADMPMIQAAGQAHGAAVVEDAACALGASQDGRPAGAWGAAGCFSFHPRKAVTTGEGGMIVTDDALLARTARVLRNHGLSPDAGEPVFERPGFNYRMTEFQAALGECQMAKLSRIVAQRRQAAARYDELLAGSEVVAPPAVATADEHVHQSYVVRLPNDVVAQRAGILAGLRQAGVEATIGTHHQPLTQYYASRYGYRRGDFPGTDEIAARSVTIPLSPFIKPHEQEEVVSTLERVITQHRLGRA